jgi:hypothetical protein
MIKVICDNCGKDMGRVAFEVEIIAFPRNVLDTQRRYCLPYNRDFKFRLCPDHEDPNGKNHVVACCTKCAIALDKKENLDTKRSAWKDPNQRPTDQN